MSAAFDCREYAAAAKRDFRPYSLGHRIMYETPLTLLTRNARADSRFAILEAGFGIGYGLDRMVEHGVIGRYLGFEPDPESFAYVKDRHGGTAGVDLRPTAFAECDPVFDHAFCIEVIEHVPRDDHRDFLLALRRSLKTSGTLWLSTPDMARSTHGVRTADEWRMMLTTAGLRALHFDAQWTDLFVCQPRSPTR